MVTIATAITNAIAMTSTIYTSESNNNKGDIVWKQKPCTSVVRFYQKMQVGSRKHQHPGTRYHSHEIHINMIHTPSEIGIVVFISKARVVCMHKNKTWKYKLWLSTNIVTNAYGGI